MHFLVCGLVRGLGCRVCANFETLAARCAHAVAVVWIPDPSLLNVDYEGAEKADQVLQSIEQFVPEQWGLPPYES
jgi:hypothetical protein